MSACSEGFHDLTFVVMLNVLSCVLQVAAVVRQYEDDTHTTPMFHLFIRVMKSVMGRREHVCVCVFSQI